jgi:ribosomal protein L25 (general stress protein Ctc)
MFFIKIEVKYGNALIIQAEAGMRSARSLNKALRRSKKIPAIIYGGGRSRCPLPSVRMT